MMKGNAAKPLSVALLLESSVCLTVSALGLQQSSSHLVQLCIIYCMLFHTSGPSLHRVREKVLGDHLKHGDITWQVQAHRMLQVNAHKNTVTPAF